MTELDELGTVKVENVTEQARENSRKWAGRRKWLPPEKQFNPTQQFIKEQMDKFKRAGKSVCVLEPDSRVYASYSYMQRHLLYNE